MQIDYLFTGGTILTMDPARRIIEDGALAVQGSSIVWLGSASEAAQFAPARVIDTRGKVIAPGMVNVHGHWAMTLFRGLVDDLPLEQWLQTIWKVEAQYTSPENVIAGVKLAIVEMIHSGTTCAADMYWQFRYATETARQAGFRMVNGPSFTEITGFQGQKSTGFEDALAYLDRYQNDPLIHLCIQTHSTYTTNYAMMAQARQIAEERGLLFITHASESRAEVQTVRAKYGKTPIEVLDAAGLLGPHTLLAHCVHLSDAEIARLAETGTAVAHCPSSNLKLASGIARVADLLRAGVTVGIGTDGPASNNDLDLFHEAQLAAMVQKGVTGDPTALPAEQVFAMLTIDGARALGLGDRIGSLEAGKLADILVLDFDAPNLTPCYDVYSHLIYAAAPANVQHVWIHGQPVMLDRQIQTLEETEVKAEVQRIAAGIQKTARE